MIDIAFEGIDSTHIKSLVQSSVPEGRTIEYKHELPGNSDGSKREFLADVSSFANSQGGDLIYGIKEVGGVAVEIPGLTDLDIDNEILRLESMIRDGIVACPQFMVQSE